MALSLRVANSSSLHTHIAHCVNMPYGLSHHSRILRRDMSTRRVSGRDSAIFQTCCALRASTRLGSRRHSLRQTRASRFGAINGKSRLSWGCTPMALVRSRRSSLTRYGRKSVGPQETFVRIVSSHPRTSFGSWDTKELLLWTAGWMVSRCAYAVRSASFRSTTRRTPNLRLRGHLTLRFQFISTGLYSLTYLLDHPTDALG